MACERCGGPVYLTSASSGRWCSRECYAGTPKCRQYPPTPKFLKWLAKHDPDEYAAYLRQSPAAREAQAVASDSLANDVGNSNPLLTASTDRKGCEP